MKEKTITLDGYEWGSCLSEIDIPLNCEECLIPVIREGGSLEKSDLVIVYIFDRQISENKNIYKFAGIRVI